MSEERNSYRQIIKATSLFGGVQIFTIIISIIRSKFIAVLLGPLGIGVMGLFNTTINLIYSITNFGLATSAVKDVAKVNEEGNENRISVIVKVLRRLVWITGLVGAFFTFLFSSFLSKLTFGNTDYTNAFLWLSITLLFNQLSSGERVLLQGLRKLSFLAKSSLLGSILGLLLVIPLYYIYGVNGIVPGMIITSLISLVLTWFYSNKIKIKDVKVSLTETIIKGKSMVIMGFMISLSSMFTMGVGYLIRIFINNIGGVEQVGLFTAGFAIINTYVGLVFSAMGTDYYPRLSSIAHDNYLLKKAVNQQAEISLLILAPILIGFLVFIKWVVVLLYSTKFLEVNPMIYWAALGMFFKAASWSIAFIFLAKGESKLFFWNELVTNVYLLLFNIIGYYYWGLEGLGVSFTITYILYLVQVFIIAKIKYNFLFTKNFSKIFIIQILLALVSFISVKLFSEIQTYIIGSILILISAWYSFKELDKRIDIKSLLKNFKK